MYGTYIHTHIQTYIHTQIHTSTCKIYIYIYIYIYTHTHNVSLSEVSAVTKLRVGTVQSPSAAQTVSSSERAVRDETYTLPSTHGFGVLSPTVKWLRYEADHSSQSRTDVQNTCSYTSTPLYIFKTWCLNKHRGDFSCMRVCFCVCVFLFLCACLNVHLCECVTV